MRSTPPSLNSCTISTADGDKMTEKVIVIGAGIGGLCTALLLAPTGREIVVLERDGPLASTDPDELFRSWKRNGVAHLRQSHAFLARLRTIMKTAHPALLDELMANGVREITFDMMLTPAQQERYRAAPEDTELTIITSRRTTLEMTMRRYVETLPNVSLRCGFRVSRLVTHMAADGIIDVTGVEGEDNGTPVTLTADIIALARQYGRYGYRRVTVLLRPAGWWVNHKRVERIWRREGLKVPPKQPKRGRLWLADGSCIRLRPEYPNHVWSYDFVEDRTHNGRKFRMLNVIDEFTRECIAIRIDRKLKSTDVIDVLSDLFILRGVPEHIRSDNVLRVER